MGNNNKKNLKKNYKNYCHYLNAQLKLNTYFHLYNTVMGAVKIIS